MRMTDKTTYVGFNCGPDVQRIIRAEAEHLVKEGRTRFCNHALAIRRLIRRADRLAKEAAAKK